MGDATIITPQAAATAPMDVLSSVRTPLTPKDVVLTLEKAATKGKMPGYRMGTQTGAFTTLAFGAPFDHELIGTAAAQDGRTLVTFRLRMLPKLPAFYAALIVVSVWPGVWLTESMLTTYFSWYPRNMWWTWAWYMPLTVGPLPWMWKKWVVGSRTAALTDARETITRIAELCNGEVAE